MTFALEDDKKMPAPFCCSQVEKDGQKEAKDAKVKAARAKHLQDTKAEREAEQAVKEAAAKRKRTQRAEV